MLCIRMWHSLSPKKVSTKTERLKIFRPSTGRLLPSLQFGDFTAYFSSLQPRLLCISSSLEGKEGGGGQFVKWEKTGICQTS